MRALIVAPPRGVIRADDKSEASRLARRQITATLSTWHGSITVVLWKDGAFTVEVAPLDGYAKVVATGSVEGVAKPK